MASMLEHGWAGSGPLPLYYAQMGEGRSCVLLHPGFGTIDSAFADLLPALAERRRVTAFEQQAHGHTPDMDRPLSYEQMVDDTANAMISLDISNADLFGWSDGGIVALGLAARHPALVRRVAIIGAGYNKEAETPEFKAKLASIDPDNPNLAPFRAAYEAVSPTPDGWPGLIAKVQDMYARFDGWSGAEIRSIRAPLMIMLGDRDSMRLEHAVELYRMVGDGRLAVLPGSDHGAPVTRSDWVVSMLQDFFDD